MAEHSPLPWHAIPDPGEVLSADGVIVAEAFGANAEFIVRACNSHDELLAALKVARMYVALRVEGVPADEHLVEDVGALQCIDAAIAKAEATHV